MINRIGRSLRRIPLPSRIMIYSVFAGYLVGMLATFVVASFETGILIGATIAGLGGITAPFVASGRARQEVSIEVPAIRREPRVDYVAASGRALYLLRLNVAEGIPIPRHLQMVPPTADLLPAATVAALSNWARAEIKHLRVSSAPAASVLEYGHVGE